MAPVATGRRARTGNASPHSKARRDAKKSAFFQPGPDGSVAIDHVGSFVRSVDGHILPRIGYLLSHRRRTPPSAERFVRFMQRDGGASFSRSDRCR